MKGLELPIGDVQFDLDLSVSGTVKDQELPTEATTASGNSLTASAAYSADLSSVDVGTDAEEEDSEENDNSLSAEEITEDNGETTAAENVYSAALEASGSETAAVALTTVVAIVNPLAEIEMYTIENVALTAYDSYVVYTENTTEFTTENEEGTEVDVYSGEKSWDFVEKASEIESETIVLSTSDTVQGIKVSATANSTPSLTSGYYLSMKSGSAIQVPVYSSATSGTVTIVSSQSASDRYVYLTSTSSGKSFPMNGSTTQSYTSSDLTLSDGIYYLTIVSDNDCKKINSITVTYSTYSSGEEETSTTIVAETSTETTTTTTTNTTTTTTETTTTAAIDSDRAYLYLVTEGYTEVSTEDITIYKEVYQKSTSVVFDDGNTVFSGVVSKGRSTGTAFDYYFAGIGTYNLGSYRTSNSSSYTITITVPNGAKSATFYFAGNSSGSNTTRTITLTRDSDGYAQVKTLPGNSSNDGSANLLAFTGLTGGNTYTLTTSGGDVGYFALGLVAYCNTVMSTEDETAFSTTEATTEATTETTTTTTTKEATTEGTTECYVKPLLWDYRANSNNLDTSGSDARVAGMWGRNIAWDGTNNRTEHARDVAPYNSAASNAYPEPVKNSEGLGSDEKECYYGGNWSVPDTSKITDVSTAYKLVSDMTYEDDLTSGYSVTVKCYTFDFDTNTAQTSSESTYNMIHHFPSNNGGATTGDKVDNFEPISQFCFSAGYFEVLVPFPENATNRDTSLTLTAEINKVMVASMSSAAEEVEKDDSDKNKNYANTGLDADYQFDSPPMKYVNMTVHADTKYVNSSGTETGDPTDYPVDTENSLPIDIDKTNTDSYGEQFLGTTWGSSKNDHDAAVVAGSEIDIWGAAMPNPQNNDYALTAIDLLQIFDSSAFEISGTVEAGYAAKKAVYEETEELFGEKGTITFLYVADTSYSDGFDSNTSGHLTAMKGVTEDTDELLFYSELSELEGDGHTCVGVLMEIRGAYIKPGTYVGMRIPVTVLTEDMDGDSTLNNVYCSVNQLRSWTMDPDLPQAAQPMYGISRYQCLSDSGEGYFGNASGNSYESQLTTTPSDTDAWVNVSGTDEGADLRTRYITVGGVEYTCTYYCADENTSNATKITSNSDGYGYFKTKYVSSYLDEYAGIIDSTTPSTSSSYYHSYRSSYNSTSTPYKYGMNVLVTGYDAGLDIYTTKDTWNKSSGEKPEFVLTDIQTSNAYTSKNRSSAGTTDLKITVEIEGDNLSLLTKAGGLVSSLTAGTVTINTTYDTSFTASSDASSLTYTDYTLSSGSVIKLSAVVTGEKTVIICIQNAPIGTVLPDITFKTRITDSASNGSTENITATIAGEYDLRFYNSSYTTSLANEAVTVAAITSLSASAYNKYAVDSDGDSVSTAVLEMNNSGNIVYRISYTNSDSSNITCLNLYDVFPLNGYNSTSIAGCDAGDRLTLLSASVTSTDSSGGTYSPPVILFGTTAASYSGITTDTTGYGYISDILSNYTSTTLASTMGTLFGIPNPLTGGTAPGTVSTFSRGKIGKIDYDSSNAGGTYTLGTAASGTITLSDYDYISGTNATSVSTILGDLSAVYAIIGYDSSYADGNTTYGYYTTGDDEAVAVKANGTVVLELTFAAD
ncbi:MAG: hypothetical protein LUD77_07385 [Clostridiales bacterium]|nr:hypothetical protein [Clostridiales bacterium]